MKCFTVTEKGVRPGLQITRDPYPHVGVGDPSQAYNYRRVEVDPALVQASSNGMLERCSITLDMKADAKGRSSYKLVAPGGEDDDRALVKLEARCAGAQGRTFYELPRNTFTVATGWFRRGAGPGVSLPANLVVLKKGDEVRIMCAEDVWTAPRPVFSVRFDGRRLTVSR